MWVHSGQVFELLGNYRVSQCLYMPCSSRTLEALPCLKGHRHLDQLSFQGPSLQSLCRSPYELDDSPDRRAILACAWQAHYLSKRLLQLRPSILQLQAFRENLKLEFVCNAKLDHLQRKKECRTSCYRHFISSLPLLEALLETLGNKNVPCCVGRDLVSFLAPLECTLCLEKSLVVSRLGQRISERPMNLMIDISVGRDRASLKTANSVC